MGINEAPVRVESGASSLSGLASALSGLASAPYRVGPVLERGQEGLAPL
jgi:hypothetical protein